MSTGAHVVTWCVAMRDKKDGGEKTIHVKCPQDCVAYKESGISNSRFRSEEGKSKHKDKND